MHVYTRGVVIYILACIYKRSSFTSSNIRKPNATIISLHWKWTNTTKIYFIGLCKDNVAFLEMTTSDSAYSSTFLDITASVPPEYSSISDMTISENPNPSSISSSEDPTTNNGKMNFCTVYTLLNVLLWKKHNHQKKNSIRGIWLNLTTIYNFKSLVVCWRLIVLELHYITAHDSDSNDIHEFSTPKLATFCLKLKFKKKIDVFDNEKKVHFFILILLLWWYVM